MILSDEEKSLIIEYRKHDEGTKRSIRILLDMEKPSRGKVVPYKTTKKKEGRC